MHFLLTGPRSRLTDHISVSLAPGNTLCCLGWETYHGFHLLKNLCLFPPVGFQREFITSGNMATLVLLGQLCTLRVHSKAMTFGCPVWLLVDCLV